VGLAALYAFSITTLVGNGEGYRFNSPLTGARGNALPHFGREARCIGKGGPGIGIDDKEEVLVMAFIPVPFAIVTDLAARLC
jgi:hypothetical protein